MEMLRVAAATADGKNFVGRHFGDAEFYDVYEVTPQEVKYLTRVTNRTEEEQGHADPKKAKGIAGLLKAQGVQVAVTRAFGPNLKRIKSKFVCILSGHDEVAAGLEQIQQNFSAVATEWAKGEERDFLDLKSQ